MSTITDNDLFACYMFDFFIECVHGVRIEYEKKRKPAIRSVTRTRYAEAVSV